jgi:hypothetical protein
VTVSDSPRPKDPARVAQAKHAIRARWGPPHVINLQDLAPEQRAFIAELVEVARRNLPALADKG